MSKPQRLFFTTAPGRALLAFAPTAIAGLLAIGVIVGLASAPVGCSSGTVTYDGSANPPGCRPPSACYRRDCACVRGETASCISCDPSDSVANPTRDCTCTAADVVCSSPAVLCVGRAPSACTGSGARCLPVGGTCADSGGIPPEMVPSRTASAAYEPRCAYVDDVCCPGSSTDGG